LALWELPELGKIWGYFGGGTTKIPPYILSTTEIPKDPSDCYTGDLNE
jgi:hypothetical protein